MRFHFGFMFIGFTLRMVNGSVPTFEMVTFLDMRRCCGITVNDFGILMGVWPVPVFDLLLSVSAQCHIVAGVVVT